MQTNKDYQLKFETKSIFNTIQIKITKINRKGIEEKKKIEYMLRNFPIVYDRHHHQQQRQMNEKTGIIFI